MGYPDGFDELVAEGESVPVAGWDFSWFEGRATEERPSWGYASLVAGRIRGAQAVLDVQTGGGEVLARVLGRAVSLPSRIAATESWPPNVDLARQRLGLFGVTVAEAADEAVLPFRDESFDLVISRHPVVTRWPDIARVLRPGGIFLSQQIGVGSNRELYEFLMGPQPDSDERSPVRAAAQARAAGLDVTDLRSEALRVEFGDVGAVVHFLRKVPWTVPDFTVDRYRDRLAALHRQILDCGPFVSHAQRFLIQASKPG